MDNPEPGQLTDEQLNEQLATMDDEGAPAPADTPPETPPVADPAAPEQTAPDTEPAPADTSTPDEPVVPDYVPENHREHYLNGNHDEVYKAYQALHQKMGQNSQFAPLLKVLREDPVRYNDALKAVFGAPSPTPATPVAGNEVDPLDALATGLAEKGYEPEVVQAFQLLSSEVKASRAAASQGLQQYQQQVTAQQQQKANSDALLTYAKENNLDQESLMSFAMGAEKVVQPSGEYGNYTLQDLKAAAIVMNPQSYEQKIYQKAQAELMEKLGKASGEETLPTTAPTVNDAHNNAPKKLENLSSADLGQLSDEDLENFGEEAGLWQKASKWMRGS